MGTRRAPAAAPSSLTDSRPHAAKAAALSTSRHAGGHRSSAAKGTGLRDEWSCCCQRLGSIWTAAASQTDGGLETNGLSPLLLSLCSPFIHLKTEEIIYSLCFDVAVWVLELKKQSYFFFSWLKSHSVWAAAVQSS